MKFLPASVAALFLVLMCVCCIFYCSSDQLSVQSGWYRAASLSNYLPSWSLVRNASAYYDSVSPHWPSRDESSREESLVTQSSAVTQGPSLRKIATAPSHDTSDTPPTFTTSTVRTSLLEDSDEDLPQRSYILTHTFGGQLTRAVRNMMMQQCWARGLSSSLALLEPFSQESQLLHMPAIWDAVMRGRARGIARFSDFFDLDLYNQASLESGGIPLVSWEEFLLRAPRQVLVVMTPQASCSLIVNHHLQTTVDKYFEDFLKTLQLMNFYIIKIVPINCYDRKQGQ